MHSHFSFDLDELPPGLPDGATYFSPAPSRWLRVGQFLFEEAVSERQALDPCGFQARTKPGISSQDETVVRYFGSKSIFPLMGRVAILISLAASAASSAQTLSPPSRSVYKCSAHGTTSYSDAPCMGAQRLDIAPTRGVGGREGRDVQRERQREMIAEAIRPLTGMDAKQYDLHGRRMKLSPDTQRECRALDTQTSEAERDEREATAERRETRKGNLFYLRQRQRDLRC